MAEVHFLPHFAEVLEQVVTAAHERGDLDVEVRPDVDPAIVAAQLRRYAADTGRPLKCRAAGDRVEVRSPLLKARRAG